MWADTLLPFAICLLPFFTVNVLDRFSRYTKSEGAGHHSSVMGTMSPATDRNPGRPVPASGLQHLGPDPIGGLGRRSIEPSK